MMQYKITTGTTQLIRAITVARITGPPGDGEFFRYSTTIPLAAQQAAINLVLESIKEPGCKRVKKTGKDVDERIAEAGNEQQAGEVAFAVEKGSTADKVLQVLKQHKFDAEITVLEVKGGAAGGHQLVKVEGVICDRRAGSAFTVWAIILPSGTPYLLSAQGPGGTDVPLWPRLHEFLIMGDLESKDDN